MAHTLRPGIRRGGKRTVTPMLLVARDSGFCRHPSGTPVHHHDDFEMVARTDMRVFTCLFCREQRYFCDHERTILRGIWANTVTSPAAHGHDPGRVYSTLMLLIPFMALYIPWPRDTLYYPYPPNEKEF